MVSRWFSIDFYYRIIVWVFWEINFPTVEYNMRHRKVRQLFQNRKKYRRCQMTIDLWLDSVSFERGRRWPGRSRTSNRHSTYFRAFWKRWFCHVNRGICDRARGKSTQIFFQRFSSTNLLWSLADVVGSWFGRLLWVFTVSAGKKYVFVFWFVVHMFDWHQPSRSIVWCQQKFSSSKDSGRIFQFSLHHSGIIFYRDLTYCLQKI